MSTLSRIIFDVDSTAPSVPTGVAVAAQSQTTLRVTWNASTDTGGAGLAGYRVYRSTTLAGTYAQVGSDLSTSSLSYDDTSLTAGSTRYYKVLAFDANGNASAQSTAASGTTTASVSFSPLQTYNFNGLTDTQSVYSTGSTAGKRWDAVPGNLSYANGFGMRGTTATKMSGKTSSMALSIATGMTGNSGDGNGSNGSFGGFCILSSPATHGQELWWRARLMFPTGWSWARGDGGDQVKFMRIERSGSPTSERLDLYCLNGNATAYNSESESKAANQQMGWGFRNENLALPNADTDFTAPDSGTCIANNTWVTVELYTYAHSDGTQARRRLWIDGVLVREQNGVTQGWLSNTGLWRTKTVSGGCRTLVNSSDSLAVPFLFTYWNGGAPANQTCYLQDMVFHKNPATLPAVDANGNPMIGTAYDPG